MIGVFDSGLGGLSVLAATMRRLPDRDFAYIADTAHVPYGSKRETEIKARVMALGGALVHQGATLLVVACNTATVAAIHALRARYPQVPVVGVEPGVKPAAQTTRSGRIAVLVTESTARSTRLADLIARHAAQVETHIVACPGWATQVEQLGLDDPALHADIAARIQPLLAAGIDRLVLGCTHYGFLSPILIPLITGRAELVDVADAVARQVERLVAQLPDAPGSGRLMLQATAGPERLLAALPALGLSDLANRAGAATLLAV